MGGDHLPPDPHAGSNGRPSAPEGRNLRVLVVEDEPAAAAAVARLLQSDGYEVHVAADGPSGLEAAQSCQPDVVLLDLGLPGMDGYEVARAVRGQRAGKRPLLIAVTGYGEKAERLRSYEAGIDLHLTKPVSVDELRQFLGRFQAVHPG